MTAKAECARDGEPDDPRPNNQDVYDCLPFSQDLPSMDNSPISLVSQGRTFTAGMISSRIGMGHDTAGRSEWHRVRLKAWLLKD
ncbi:hypothetical protein KHP60_24795 [Microvirga sp. 3-52]|jgi:hypothetical protein|uniref:hypothetical protein n=1 Tax=Microvirga sp. 3-52 TaxID=2792425 RepID=UPI001BD08871|nr:hypothetical protein [Microvirga sp. 3-52]MBS7455501.1 hypothetical protein [Microvirga sp. 3-52]